MKKILLLLIFLLAVNNGYCASVTSYTENVAPADNDVFYLVDDPAGTPANNKIKYSTIKNDITSYFDTEAEFESLLFAITTPTELTTALATQDACSEITGCITGAYSTLGDLQSAVTNDFHNLGGTDLTGATSLTGLTDIGSATATAGNILIADGSNFESVSISGCTLSSAGLLTCSGGGDMLQATYDTNTNNIVDSVENVNYSNINWTDFIDGINSASINWNDIYIQSSTINWTGLNDDITDQAINWTDVPFISINGYFESTSSGDSYIMGNVGIGTSAPSDTLEINDACILMTSPDASKSSCCVDNSDVWTCTGI